MKRFYKTIALGAFAAVACIAPAGSAMAATNARSAVSPISTVTAPTAAASATAGATGGGTGSGGGKPKPLTCQQAIDKAQVHITMSTFWGILGQSAQSAAEAGKAQGLVEGACGVAV